MENISIYPDKETERVQATWQEREGAFGPRKSKPNNWPSLQKCGTATKPP